MLDRIASWFSIAFGIAALLAVLPPAANIWSARQWPAAPAILRASGTSSTGFVYEFEVGSSRYVGERLTLFALSGAGIQPVSERYSADKVIVRYNPADPNDAFIESGAVVLAIFSVCLGVAPVLWGALSLARRRAA